MNLNALTLTRRLLLLAGLLAATAHAQSADAPPPLRVVASFSILADMVAEVGGDAVSVSMLVGPDADAHVFAPSPADARRLAQAELVVVNGLGFEGWMARLIKASGYRGPVLVATRGIKPLPAGKGSDPHAWQSLPNARVYVANIQSALVAARPAQRESIERRAAEYRQRIDRLDAEVRQRLAVLPTDERRVISAHDAFAYFGAEYGVRFIAPQGWSTDSEASAADVAQIVRQVKARRVRAIFVENIADPRLVQRIADEAGAVVGGTLFSDALSARGGVADTYLRMFSHNSHTIGSAFAVAPNGLTTPTAARP